MTKKTSRKRTTIPMRGGLLGDAASLFRLREACTQAGGVSEGTARRALSDQSDVGHDVHTKMLTTLVDRLFTHAYLGACGLSDQGASEHNGLLVDALDGVLIRWDRTAAWLNSDAGLSDQAKAFVAMTSGIHHDVAVRLAAYAVLYEHMHTVLPGARLWARKPGIRAWWEETIGRAPQTVRLNGLVGRGVLDRNTLRGIRAGKTVPRDDVIGELAARLADHGIRGRRREAMETSAEIEFEIRLACALALLAPRFRSFVSRYAGATPMMFDAFHRVLATRPREEVVDLLRFGTESAAWSSIEPVVRAVSLQGLMSVAARMKRDADEKVELLRRDPEAAIALAAEEFERQARSVESANDDPGADDYGALLAEFFRQGADLFGSISDPSRRPPQRRPGFDAELRAAGLCYQAMAPWNGCDDREKERLFRKALRECPTSAHAHREFGDHLRQVGRRDEALGHLRESVRLNPVHRGGRERLCLALIELDAYEEILETTADQSSSLLRICHALALVEMGRAVEARPIIQSEVEAHPHDPFALQVHAECEAALGLRSAATETRRKATFYSRGVRRG